MTICRVTPKTSVEHFRESKSGEFVFKTDVFESHKREI